MLKRTQFQQSKFHILYQIIMLKTAFNSGQIYLQAQKIILFKKKNYNKLIQKTAQNINNHSLINKQIFTFAKVSWKKLMQSYNYRNSFFEQYSINNINPRLETNQCSILIYPFSPMYQRVGEFQFFVAKSPMNYLLTFLERIEGVDYQLLWKNRKTFGLSIKDIFRLEKYKIDQPILIIQKLKEHQESNDLIKILTIGTSYIKQDDQQLPRISIKFQIFTKGPQRNLKQWQKQLLFSPNDFQQFILASKKQIYHLSGMTAKIYIQRKQIIQKLNKKSLKEQTVGSSMLKNLDLQD